MSAQLARVHKKPLSRYEKKEALTGLLFVLPYLALFVLFTGIPFIAAFALSFFNVKFISRLDNLRFVGVDNFIRAFQSKETMAALGRSGTYSLIYVPLIMVLGFALAYLLNKEVYCKKLIRSTVFLPYVSNLIAIGVVFKLLLNTRGPMAGMYALLGMDRPLFLSLQWALPTVAVIAVWKGIGLNMLTFLGALQNVPRELTEAAQIDGANKWQQVRNVVIPSISGISFFLLISSIITSLQNYTIIQAFTEGGPGQASTTMAISIVKTAFTSFETSFASAQALIVFAIVMLFTAFQWRGQQKMASN